jgi:hypothetical protein
MQCNMVIDEPTCHNIVIDEPRRGDIIMEIICLNNIPRGRGRAKLIRSIPKNTHCPLEVSSGK